MGNTRKWYKKLGLLNTDDMRKLSNKYKVNGLTVNIQKQIECLTWTTYKIKSKGYGDYFSIGSKVVLD